MHYAGEIAKNLSRYFYGGVLAVGQQTIGDVQQIRTVVQQTIGDVQQSRRRIQQTSTFPPRFLTHKKTA